jgi:hypothetical protein
VRTRKGVIFVRLFIRPFVLVSLKLFFCYSRNSWTSVLAATTTSTGTRLRCGDRSMRLSDSHSGAKICSQRRPSSRPSSRSRSRRSSSIQEQFEPNRSTTVPILHLFTTTPSIFSSTPGIQPQYIW